MAQDPSRFLIEMGIGSSKQLTTEAVEAVAEVLSESELNSTAPGARAIHDPTVGALLAAAQILDGQTATKKGKRRPARLAITVADGA
jgi:hypothetical protein